jgi:hypothetical protein
MKEALIGIAIFVAAFVYFFFAMHENHTTDSSLAAIQPGSLCTVDDGDGLFRVAKVLLMDDSAVHIRLYANRWKQRPSLAEIEQTRLSMGSIENKEEGLGMGHLPLSLKTFAHWKAEPLKVIPVTDDELEGYKLWKEANGGLF